MSEKRILEQLESVTFKILADMFFLFPEEIKDINLPKEIFEGKISINSENKINLRFFISQKLAKTMAENFMGEVVSEDEINEVIKEFVNMIGGNFIARIDPEGKKKLDLPYVTKIKTINLVPDLKKYEIEGEFFAFTIERE